MPLASSVHTVARAVRQLVALGSRIRFFCALPAPRWVRRVSWARRPRGTVVPFCLPLLPRAYLPPYLLSLDVFAPPYPLSSPLLLVLLPRAGILCLATRHHGHSRLIPCGGGVGSRRLHPRPQ